MNMKSLLKELVKDPQIKALYNQGFDRSVINKLIIESLMEEEDKEEKDPKEAQLREAIRRIIRKQLRK